MYNSLVISNNKPTKYIYFIVGLKVLFKRLLKKYEVKHLTINETAVMTGKIKCI